MSEEEIVDVLDLIIESIYPLFPSLPSVNKIAPNLRKSKHHQQAHNRRRD